MPVPEVCRASCNRNKIKLTRHSGAATTASRLGQPDLAIATMNDFVDAGKMHASINPSVPVIADADTGYASADLVFPLIAN